MAVTTLLASPIVHLRMTTNPYVDGWYSYRVACSPLPLRHWKSVDRLPAFLCGLSQHGQVLQNVGRLCCRVCKGSALQPSIRLPSFVGSQHSTHQLLSVDSDLRI